MSGCTFIAGGTVVTPQGRGAADIAVQEGVITAIGPRIHMPANAEIIDISGLYAMPGVIDPHSHFWEAGFAADANFTDSSASAVAGGITTTLDMPLTEPCVLDAETFREKAALGEKTSYVDFALHGGVSPDNLGELEGMWRAGASALKIFTCETGSPMAGVIDDADLLAAISTIGGFGGLATFHAENNSLLLSNLRHLHRSGRTDNAAFNAWHDETAELEAINRILFYAERTRTRVNIVHVTSPTGVAMVTRARKRGISATAETCPHYLYFTSDDIVERGAWLTCAPPMRDAEALAGLRQLVASGDVATLGSDHCPVDPAMKVRGHNNILDALPGLPGNETLVPLLLNLVAAGCLTLERMAAVTAEAPARLYGLYPRKGAIEIGSDADFTIVDPDRQWTVRAESLVGKARWTPYEGFQVQGRVQMTIIRGRVVAKEGKPVGDVGGAKFVPRQDMAGGSLQ